MDGVTRLTPAVLIALSGLVMLWSRLILINQSLWGDEAGSIARYIDGGPAAIWDVSRWIPNDHILFELLTWATTGVLGSHAEATYRLWGVFPAMAAGALMTYWLWRRIDRWAAAIFAVLGTAAPLYLDLSWQARGYGRFLAGVLVVIGADLALRRGTRTSSLLLGLGGFVGMATLENFVGVFIAAVLVVGSYRPRRLQAIVVLIYTGVATLIWYSPLLSKIIGYENPYGRRLPWYAFTYVPMRDLFGAGVNAIDPSISVTVGSIAAGLLIVLGGVVLWRRRERRLVGVLAAPPLATYLLIEAAAKYAPRFGASPCCP